MSWKRLRWILCGIACLAAIAACTPAPSEAPAASNADSLAHTPAPLPAPAPVIGELEQTLIDSGLLDIQREVPGIRVELKYSTTDNFVKQDVYGDLERCYLRPEAVTKLKQAQSLLQAEHPGWTLLVYDGVRPHRIQTLMWEQLDIPFKRNYLAPPWEGSVHNYGCAVDLTIADEKGVPIDMGTPFDFFGKEAQPQLEGVMLAQGKLTEVHIANRKLLRRVMKEAGFFDIHTEWWHFNAVANATARKRFTRIP
jgi:zinc D-Ala-D-Ala dipeptidase